MTRDEFLVRDFLETWLYPAYDSGAFRVRPEDSRLPRDLRKRGATPSTRGASRPPKRVAAGLLKIAVDFGLLRGSIAKEFASYHLPERRSSTCLHAMRDAGLSPQARRRRRTGGCS
jgi:hypothetical protein